MSVTGKDEFRKVVLTETQISAAEKILKEFAAKTGSSVGF